MRFLLVLALLAIPSSSHAEDAPKSETTALAISVGGTVASWAMLIAAPYLDDKHGEGFATVLGTAGALGTVFAPSFGHWYAGAGSARGLGFRLIGIGLAGVGIVLFSPCFSDANEFDSPTCRASLGIGFGVAGAAAFLGGTIYDFATSARSARTHNRLRLVPTLQRDGAGLALGGKF